MPILSTFDTATLSVLGTADADPIVISRDAAGQILVNDGAVPTTGGTPSVANTTLLKVRGEGGDDTLTLDETNGALPSAHLWGGAGKDALTGGSAADKLQGGSGDDTLLGKGGDDHLIGGSGNDLMVGGTGTDRASGGAGDDRFVWNPGDGNDVFDGGAGTDTLEVNGGGAGETFSITADGDRVRFERVSPAPFCVDAGTTEKLVLNANGGDDVISAGNGLASRIELTLDGGAGNDSITGGDGADKLLGGDGDDLITGGRGNDRAWMGAGDDVFVWNPGDGSDAVKGQSGLDTLRFNGANADENIDIAADGSRARFFRDVGAITMDLSSVERIEFAALGGADSIVMRDLAGSGTKEVAIDLAATLGGSTGDAQVDTVTLRGTKAAETVEISGGAGAVSVAGLAAAVSISHAEAGDRLLLQTLGGNDTVNASTLAAGTVELTIDSGSGNDTVTGSQGVDLFLAGSGRDLVTGGRGNDTALMGSGNDTFVWNPGDGSDTVEGQSGTDTLRFNGANANENIDISANGNRATFFRDVASITMDLNDVERIDFNALGGADTVLVHDLAGTDVKRVAVDLAGTLGGTEGDGQADRVTVEGTGGDDAVTLTHSGTTTSVRGLAARVDVEHFEAGDTLVVQGLAGDDILDASALRAGAMPVVLEGGEGSDTFVGGQATIADFAEGDKIDLRALGNATDFDGLIAEAQELQGNVVLDLGDDRQLTLQGISIADLEADDFLFSTGAPSALEAALT